MHNPLREAGLPLCFRVADSIDFEAPRTAHGISCRSAVRSLSHMQKEALVHSARSGETWRMASDEGAYLNGLDEAPCPLCFFTTGMVADSMNGILQLARARGISIHNIRLVQDNYYTMQGSMLRGTMTGGARDVELEVQMDSSADQQANEALVRDALALSPLHGLLEDKLTSLFALSHNDEVLPVTGVSPLEDPRLAAPDALFEGLRPQPSGIGDVIVNTGVTTPEHEHTSSSAGSSLQEQQDRLLHIRGICTLREDGLKLIEQHLFNPQGSIFRLLSDEAGRAPEALSYLSAGIGFCFMTQFGRAAAIYKKELDSYRILQDTCFYPGGDTAAEQGRTEPVKSHVFLDSGFDHDYAQHLLLMAEQTCFLHALCRTSLTTRARVTAYA